MIERPLGSAVVVRQPSPTVNVTPRRDRLTSGSAWFSASNCNFGFYSEPTKDRRNVTSAIRPADSGDTLRKSMPIGFSVYIGLSLLHRKMGSRRLRSIFGHPALLRNFQRQKALEAWAMSPQDRFQLYHMRQICVIQTSNTQSLRCNHG